MLKKQDKVIFTRHHDKDTAFITQSNRDNVAENEEIA